MVAEADYSVIVGDSGACQQIPQNLPPTLQVAVNDDDDGDDDDDSDACQQIPQKSPTPPSSLALLSILSRHGVCSTLSTAHSTSGFSTTQCIALAVVSGGVSG